MLRVLAITKIFPNRAEPLSAPFNRQQFSALSKLCELQVMATIPWYPGAGLFSKWSSAGRLSAVPSNDVIDGIAVRHARTLFVPRMAPATWGPLYAASIARDVARLRGKVDVVLGSWAYPDGFAAVLAAKALGAPAVIKLHGSDINVIAKQPGPRRLVRWALRNADRVVAVSAPLADEAAALGASPSRVAIVRNGVDASRFYPRDRAEARRSLGLAAAAHVAVFVGNLKENKGVLDLAAAFFDVRAAVAAAQLVIVGEGPARAAVHEAVAPLGECVQMVGARPPDEVATWMAAADVLVLPSWSEGTPNVVLEALASGRRVVAAAVGGIPDLLHRPELGELVPAKQPRLLASALTRALTTEYDSAQVASLAASGGWESSAQALLAVLEAAHASPRSPAES